MNIENHLQTVRTETRWLRTEEGEHRIVLRLFPEDLAIAQQMFQRTGQLVSVVLLPDGDGDLDGSLDTQAIVASSRRLQSQQLTVLPRESANSVW